MVTHLPIEQIDSKKLFLDCLPTKTKRAFLFSNTLPLFESASWYLAGGTALALQVGHRQSLDLDFFTTEAAFSETAVEAELLATGKWSTGFRERGTIYGKFMDAKMSLIAYPFFIPSPQILRCGTIRILVPSDIASMKIVAISQRGRKRDFVDLYWYCNNRESLISVISRAITQYPGQEDNLPHILKSLTYFADAEEDPMPELLFSITWAAVKKYFQKEVPRITREILEIK